MEVKIETFAKLGELLQSIGEQGSMEVISDAGLPRASFDKYFQKALSANPWFTPESIYAMFYALGVSLSEEDLRNWMEMYDVDKTEKEKTVAVIMAGNIPAVGFHDFLCVLMAGHKIQAKLSSDDKYLIPALAGLLIAMEPGFDNYIEFRDEKINDFDAVIATGSNNTSRYFNYYFGKYPHIIRKNRNALAVITGKESKEELTALGNDIFTYYGLGCRNVSRVFVPQDYDFKEFFEAIEDYSSYGDHHKYRNNYDYNKSIFLVNGDAHFDNGFLLIKEDAAMTSPVSVLHYERYKMIAEVNDFIDIESDHIQCVISADQSIPGAIPPGTGQHPRLWDYADGVDTIEFLLGL